MPKYRKKPVVIEAFEWTGDEKQKENPIWIIEGIKQGIITFNNQGTENVFMLIKTLEGMHKANRGDFIIQGVQGELYPCKPDIFHATYTAV